MHIRTTSPAVGSLLGAIAIAWAFPAAIVAIGVPVVLAVRGLVAAVQGISTLIR